MKIHLCILLAAFIGLEKVFASIPVARYSGDSVLLNKRLYYFGGRPSNNGRSLETIQDFIHLDISESFNINEAQSKWQGVPVTGSLTAEKNYEYAMGAFPEDNSIIIYGGSGSNRLNDTMHYPVMLFNATSNSWQNLPESPSPMKQPYPDGVDPANSRKMNIYDLKSSMWSSGSPLPSSMYLRYYTPTTLIGKDLYYIGGMTISYTKTEGQPDTLNFDILIPLTEILIYHTEDNTWELKNATGADIPEPRISHTITAINNVLPIAEGVCYTLDTSSMTWKKQDLSGQGPGPLRGHSAVFADNSSLLFVMFGVNSADTVQSSFNVLDTDEWKWVDQYNSPYPSLDDSGASNDGSVSGGSNNTGAIAGAVVGGVAVVALVLAFCLYTRKKRNARNKENIPHGEAYVKDINNGSLAARGHFKPEDASDVILNATLHPLLPAETAPPYHGNVPNEIDPPKSLLVQNMINAQTGLRPQTLRPVKPDGE
ncbi:hypothetical protein INT45_011495 [Circinella minor]|uniref:Galactose oxidase n=1 Tax=Circinella minor TaxID=1195481 RepID=A0A8H7VEW6_9FUNG|nr:hypothetical protein INT45_011495 [Circinella minor]